MVSLLTLVWIMLGWSAPLPEARQQLDALWFDLMRFFSGTPLDYRGAAQQFTRAIAPRAEAVRVCFLTAVVADPQNRLAVEGLFDALELLASGWMLVGNEQLVEALDRRYRQPGFDLLQVTNELREADRSWRRVPQL